MKPAYVLAFIVLVASLVFTLVSFSGAVAQHVTIRDAMARPGETVQVPGRILKDTVRWEVRNGEGTLQFDVADRDDPTQRMRVVYHERPENFDSAESVEAIGRYRDGAFYADNLLVKCPSKYQGKK